MAGLADIQNKIIVGLMGWANGKPKLTYDEALREAEKRFPKIFSGPIDVQGSSDPHAPQSVASPATPDTEKAFQDRAYLDRLESQPAQNAVAARIWGIGDGAPEATPDIKRAMAQRPLPPDDAGYIQTQDMPPTDFSDRFIAREQAANAPVDPHALVQTEAGQAATPHRQQEMGMSTGEPIGEIRGGPFIFPKKRAWRLPNETGGEPASQFEQKIAAASAEAGIDPRLLSAVVQAESGGNPNAANDKNPKRERSYGLAQININPTAHPEVTKEQAKNPDFAIPWAARELAQLKKRFRGDDRLALAAYQWGVGNVERHMSAGGTFETMPQSVQESVGGRLAAMNGQEPPPWSDAPRQSIPPVEPDQPGQAPVEQQQQQQQQPVHPENSIEDTLAQVRLAYEQKSMELDADTMRKEQEAGKNISELKDRISRARQQYEAMQVDPGRSWKDKSTFSKGLTLLASALGGFAEGFTGGAVKNRVLERLEQEANRDVQLQLEEIKRKGSGIDLNENMLARQYKELGSIRAAANETKRILVQELLAGTQAVAVSAKGRGGGMTPEQESMVKLREARTRATELATRSLSEQDKVRYNAMRNFDSKIGRATAALVDFKNSHPGVLNELAGSTWAKISSKLRMGGTEGTAVLSQLRDVAELLIQARTGATATDAQIETQMGRVPSLFSGDGFNQSALDFLYGDIATSASSALKLSQYAQNTAHEKIWSDELNEIGRNRSSTIGMLRNRSASPLASSLRRAP